ncbi:MAG: DUF2284 domain-containing protein [Lachnospiraceae bacterium]|jgi:predicted metal-binding protein|nr:DUF2284 domain-containing protein [Lachnospiraceae bacterium]MCI8994525.1 DUF2284 domain-containing protein [Lachnospiraceae bacterium]MCI9133847.1 DUF2284 domain-containing protein [Lachnospiraceae bacterium]
MNKEAWETSIAPFPICEYAWIAVKDIPFLSQVRYICETECPRYGTSWSCPPAVGTVEECRERCLAYEGAFLFTTMAEVTDISDLEETLRTRKEHEEVTRQVGALMGEQCERVLILSTESCANCETCTYPGAPCRHPDRMFPCIESYGILVTELAERNGISFLSGGNIVVWFSLIFYA